MLTIAWQVNYDGRSSYNIFGFVVNENKNLHDMPKIEMNYYIQLFEASKSMGIWIDNVVEANPDKTFQIIEDKQHPRFNSMVKYVLREKNLDFHEVNLKNLYAVSDLSQEQVMAQIRDQHDWNEYLDDIRRSFYNALEVIALQENIRETTKQK